MTWGFNVLSSIARHLTIDVELTLDKVFCGEIGNIPTSCCEIETLMREAIQVAGVRQGLWENKYKSLKDWCGIEIIDNVQSSGVV